MAVKAEEDTRAGSLELRAITDYAEDYIVLYGLDFRHLFVSRSVADAVGRPPEDFPGHTLEEMGVPDALAQRYRACMQRVLETGAPEVIEHTVRLHSDTRQMHCTLSPVKHPDGSLRALIGVTRDLTELKRAEALSSAQMEAMREIAGGATPERLMETMVRLTEQHAPRRKVSILLLAEDGRRLKLGHAPNLPAELIDAICREPIGPENGCCGAAAFHKHTVITPDIASDAAWARHRELALKHGLGACWSQPILSQDGDLLGTVAMYHTKARPPYERELQVINETALMAAIAIQHWREHESLLESQTRYRMLTENAANIVSVNDASGIMSYISPAVETILGYKPEELIGQPGGQRVHPDDLPATLEARARLRGEVGYQGVLRYRYRHKNGTWRTLEAIAKSALDHKGNYISVVSARDVTDREETEARLKESEARLERALEASGLGTFDWDMATSQLHVDGRMADFLGYVAADVPNDITWLLGRIHPDERQNVYDTMVAHLKGQTPFFEIEFRARGQEGAYKWVHCRGLVTARAADGRALRMTGTSRDIHEQKNLKDTLARALAAADLGTWEWDLASSGISADARCIAILGHRPEVFRRHMDSLVANIHADDATRCARIIEAHLRGETPHFEFECRTRMEDGGYRWIRNRGQITVRDETGPCRVTGTIKDIAGEKHLQSRMEDAVRRVQLLLEATDEGIIGLEPDGTVSFVNPAATQLLGCAANALLGQDFDRAIQHTREDGERLLGHDSPIHRCLTEGRRHRSGSDDLFTCGARSFPVDFSVSPILTEQAGEGAVLVFHDVSEKRTLAHQLHFQALHDPLTGLVNRRGFETKLTELLTSAKQDGRDHALCYLDLDHFKLVNDTCGHAAGDELLRQLPKMLQPLVRAHDTLARLGGDEFALLLYSCPLEQAAKIAEKVRDAVKAFRFIWQYRSFTIGASIGVVGITAESQGLVSVLGAADAACYVAKDQGPNNIHVSYPHDLAIIRRRGEMRWVARLKNALEENRFTLYYQSIQAFERPQDAPLHHELLIRLLDAKGDIILPGVFIAAAERYQLMPSIDQWVIEHALQQLGAAVAGNPKLARHRFGINLSGESLRDMRLLDVVRGSLAQHRVPPTMLYFEITETAAISNLGAAVEFMNGLKQLGCQLALDDFGSGMSSFSYLKHLPVDYLKIDGSFVKDILNNPVDQAIVRAINSVGQQMGIRTVAEFVENQAIAGILREIGVNYAQGFGIARPKPLEEFIAASGEKVAASA